MPLLDVSSLMGGAPAAAITACGAKRLTSKSMTGSSDGMLPTAAPPTPTSDDDPTDAEDNDADADADTYDEADQARHPLPAFLTRPANAAVVADAKDDLAWADVTPPLALLEMPETFAVQDDGHGHGNDGHDDKGKGKGKASTAAAADVPELLRELVVSSVDSLRAQVAAARADRADRVDRAAKAKAAAAEAAKAAAAEVAVAAAAVAAEMNRRRASLNATLPPLPAGPEKGKARDNATRHLERVSSLRIAAAGASAAAANGKRPSRRQLLASRLLRHVHVRTGSSSSSSTAGPTDERGESSAAGAAAGAAERRQMALLAGSASGSGGGGSSRRDLWPFLPPPITVVRPASAAIALAVATEPGTAAIPQERRSAMLMALVMKDMEKKKEPVPPATMCVSFPYLFSGACPLTL